MRFLADENIPLIREMLSPCGETVTVHGRQITPDLLKGFDALLVRSITRVDASLLAGSNIQFVGTATAGTDHVDKDWLCKNGITFADATGSNANSVAEYVVALILKFCAEKSLPVAGKSIGIIGIGNIGSKIVRMATALDMRVLQNDPILEQSGVKNDWKSIDELYQCDFLTIHTPLTKEGDFITKHLFTSENIRRFKSDLFLINTARGEIVNNSDLLDALVSGTIRYASLDVWENEPRISIPLLEKTYHATPHVAGYSYDGKFNGTIMLYKAIIESFGPKSAFDPESIRPKVLTPEISFDNSGLSHERSLLDIIQTVYNFNKDHTNMQKMREEKSPEARGDFFDRLRKEYPVRREFSNYCITLAKSDPELIRKLNGLGFRTAA